MAKIICIFFYCISVVVCSEVNASMLSEIKNRIYHFRERSPKAEAYAQYCMAVIYEKKGQLDDAMRLLEEAGKNDPSAGSINVKTGSILLRKKQYEAAISQFVEAQEKAYKNLFLLHFLLGISYYKTKNIPQAINHYEIARRINPENVGIYITLADIYSQQEEYAKALSTYEQATKINPEMAILWFKLGLLYGKELRYQEAIAVLKKAIGLKEDWFQAHLGLALVYEAIEDSSSAISEYQQILKIAPLNVNVYKRLASLYLGQKEYEKAMHIYNLMIILDPEDATNYISLSYLLLKKEEPEKAVVILEEALKKGLKTVEVYFILGLAYETVANIKQEKQLKTVAGNYYKKAIEIYKQGINLNVSNDLFYFHIGGCYDKLGMPQKAEESFLKTIELNPKNADAYNYLGYMLTESGKNLEKAKEYIKKALDLDPENAAYIDSYGWVLLKLGKVNESLVFLEKAVQKLPEDDAIRYHLGEVYFLLGDWERAISEWEESLSLNPERTFLKEKITVLKKKISSQETNKESSTTQKPQL